MPVTVGTFDTTPGLEEQREAFKKIFDIVRDDTFPDIVPTATSLLAKTQLRRNGIDVAAISPDIATFLEEATVRGIIQRLLLFSLCQVCSTFILSFYELIVSFYDIDLPTVLFMMVNVPFLGEEIVDGQRDRRQDMRDCQRYPRRPASISVHRNASRTVTSFSVE
jgi:hypothetical protein